jgi:hypothetical protein
MEESFVEEFQPEELYVLISFPIIVGSDKIFIKRVAIDLEDGNDIESIDYANL